MSGARAWPLWALASGAGALLVTDRNEGERNDVPERHGLDAYLHPQGVAALRGGVFDRVTATGCPPVHTYSFDFGPFTIEGSPGTPDSPVSYCPRRTVFDKVLVQGAAEAGAEVREGFGVEEVVIEDGRVTGIRGSTKGGSTVTERARIVIGADGLRPFVARMVGAEQYNEHGRGCAVTTATGAAYPPTADSRPTSATTAASQWRRPTMA